MLEELQCTLASAARFRRKNGRPFVIVTYAQGLDGSIASRNRKPLAISGEESMQFTHWMRSIFDAILVGIGTVRVDNPHLTVRKVDGISPQPVVLDTRLRISRNANLIRRGDRPCWVIGGMNPDRSRRVALERAGAKVLPCRTAENGRIDLHRLMQLLIDHSVNSLMVEGGARVITGFVNAGLIDRLIVTISPKFIGGLNAIDRRSLLIHPFLSMEDVSYRPLGDDIILSARPRWKTI
jgi:3,4-dihydroxy 2-butanone 4-phosphate synthase/GTP cyclohydrolase II